MVHLDLTIDLGPTQSQPAQLGTVFALSHVGPTEGHMRLQGRLQPIAGCFAGGVRRRGSDVHGRQLPK